MRYLVIVSGVVCLSFMLLPACAPAPEPEPEAAPEPRFDREAEEAAIWDWWEQSVVAFNNQDLEGATAHFDEVYENWTGDRKGARPFIDYYTDFFERQPDFQGKLLEKIAVIFVTPDVAIAKAYVEYTGMLDADGEPLPPQKTLHAEVAVRKGGKWLRAAAFNRPVEE